MSWLAWRQHRAQLSSGAALVAVLGLFMLWTHHTMTVYVRTSGLAACLSAGGECGQLRADFIDHFRNLTNGVGWFNFFPLAIGMFWGAPLIAREVEQGTHRLVWTQTVTRRRWFLSRLGLLVMTATLATVVFSRVVVWWFGAFDRQDFRGFSHMTEEIYNFSDLVPVGYTLYALALAVAAGALLRRTLPAMAVTIALWLPLRIAMESLRGHLLTPLKVSYPPLSLSPRAGLGDWVLDGRMVGPDGTALRFGPVGSGPCGDALDKGSLAQCLSQHGFHQVDTYQPASRFWELQSIEFAVFGGLALVLLVVAYVWVTRKATA